MLEWFQPTSRSAVQAGILIALLVIGFLTLKDWGFGWIRVWWLWLIVAIPPLPLFFALRAEKMAAGADWYARGKSWVDTYHLTSIRLVKAWGSPDLELEDADGRRVSISIADIQRNRELWDLVYNGIRHSVYKGRAAPNQMARDALQLQDVPVSQETVDADSAGRTTPPLSRTARRSHVALATVCVIAGVLALAIAALGLTNPEVRGTGSGLAGMAVLAVVGVALIWGFRRLMRRVER